MRTAPLTLYSAEPPLHTIKMHSSIHTPVLSALPLFSLRAAEAIHRLLTIAIWALIRFVPHRQVCFFAVFDPLKCCVSLQSENIHRWTADSFQQCCVLSTKEKSLHTLRSATVEPIITVKSALQNKIFF